MKAVAAMLMLLVLVVAEVNADHGGHDHHRGHGSRSWHEGANDDDGHRRSSHPMAGLTQCVTICGSAVTSCMLDCYKPLIDLDPVELPVCLLKCTNDALICASACPVTGNV